MMQASIGAGYIKNILMDRVNLFIHRTDAKPELPLRVVIRKAFNPNGDASWFGAIVALVNQITTLTVVLTGAALIREREHGTIEHLLTLPLTPFEIAMSKVWANGLVILTAVAASMYVVVRTLLDVPIAGSLPLFFLGVVLYLFFATALGLYLGTISRSMAQFPSDHPGHHRPATPVGRQHARGEPAAVDAAAHAVAPLSPLRRLLPAIIFPHQPSTTFLTSPITSPSHTILIVRVLAHIPAPHRTPPTRASPSYPNLKNLYLELSVFRHHFFASSSLPTLRAAHPRPARRHGLGRSPTAPPASSPAA